jgi:hypothetical protein
MIISVIKLNAKFITLHGVVPSRQGGGLRPGAPSRSRTCDLSLRKAALYPAELWVHAILFNLKLHCRFSAEFSCRDACPP